MLYNIRLQLGVMRSVDKREASLPVTVICIPARQDTS